MAMHIYMKNAAGSYNYRGEAGPNDDPVSFRRLMAARGQEVVISATAPPGAYLPNGNLDVARCKNIAAVDIPELNAEVN